MAAARCRRPGALRGDGGLTQGRDGRAIGADRVIDYSREDFTDGFETYDVIFDVVRDTPSGRMVRSLNEDGCLLMANPGFLQIVRARWAARGSRKRVSFAGSSGTGEDLAYLRGLIEAG